MQTSVFEKTTWNKIKSVDAKVSFYQSPNGKIVFEVIVDSSLLIDGDITQRVGWVRWLRELIS